VEWDATRIRTARLVAAPGCFPTASLLALLPFLQQGLIEPGGIVIDAKTGTSGGGRAAKENLLLAEASEAVAPYGVVGHRHTSEIEQIAGQAAGQPIQLQFTPHLIPMVRGILATIYASLRDPGLVRDDLPPPEEDEFYWEDLIGLDAVDPQGQKFGVVSGLLEAGAHDVLVIDTPGRTAAGKPLQVLVPFVERHVGEVDLAKKQVVVDWEEPV
jgi:hypothetical protein